MEDRTPTIDRESAELEFERFCDAARIRIERYRSDESAENFKELSERFIDGVMYGKITVDDNGWPTVKTEHPEVSEVRFPRRPCGHDRIIMDKVKENQSELRLFTWIGSVVKLSATTLQRLEEHDMALVRCVFYLFQDA